MVHDLAGYAIAATKNQAIEAIVSVMLRSLQARFRDSFITNLPSRVMVDEIALGYGSDNITGVAQLFI